MSAPHLPESPSVLAGGSWQPGRWGVQVWIPHTTSEVVARGGTGWMIACPTCRAKVNQTCTTISGHTRNMHKSRLAPRLCDCGELLAWKRRLCDNCREAATRESKRIRAPKDRERKAAYLRERRARRAPCGTDSGYYRHVRGFKEPACFECLDAHRVATRERQQRRRDAA